MLRYAWWKKTVWRNAPFLRVSGFADSVLHKAALQPGDSGVLLRSGRIEEIDRKFRVYEAAAQKALIARIGPLQKEMAQDLCAYKALPGKSAAAAPQTSWELKRSEEQQKQRHTLARSMAKSLVSLDENVARFDNELSESLALANTGIARYARAAFFRVVDREIPTIHCHIRGRDCIDEALRENIKEALTNV